MFSDSYRKSILHQDFGPEAYIKIFSMIIKKKKRRKVRCRQLCTEFLSKGFPVYVRPGSEVYAHNRFIDQTTPKILPMA